MKYDALGYYQLLGVSPQSDEEQIKQTYRDLAKFWHPDHNKEENALEKFQKLSVAYDVLKDATSRLRYDLLSMVYTDADYPEYENIAPFADIEGDANVRAFMLCHVRGKLIKYTQNRERKILCRSNAAKTLGQTALANWLLGWWHPTAIIKNIQALFHNYNQSFSTTETFRVLIHNIVAYHKQENIEPAVASAVSALEFADESEKVYLEHFISMAGIRVARPQPWKDTPLKLIQLIVPLTALLFIAFCFAGNVLLNKQMTNWWGNNKEISYYQEVNTGYHSQTVDDVVVGKIHNIPVNKSDRNRLYHLQREAVVMYGPSDEFDVLKKLPADTTVRLTGYSPDNVWARILIDNGEMGFVRMNILIKGIGKEVPFGSAVYEE
ncbi:MAG: J domain-containing protein [Alphaproteobacteria bacterium]|nr:J domain-containing protein [Alphaproteobacteria bacterium]